MRALVISGGGARGSWAAGAISYLLEQWYRYDMVVGTSAGALLAPAVVLAQETGDRTKLRELWTTTTRAQTLRNRVPTNAVIPNAIAAMLTGASGAYDSMPLLNSIRDRLLTPAEFETLKESPVPAVVCYNELTTGTSRYEDQYDRAGHGGYTVCIWWSCLIPGYMSVDVCPDWGYIYCDGGILDPVPLGEACHRGATEIDCIVLQPAAWTMKQPKSLFAVSMAAIERLQQEGVESDIRECVMLTKMARIGIPQIRHHHVCRPVVLRVLRPKDSIGPALEFNPATLKRYWDEGHEYAAVSANWEVHP